MATNRDQNYIDFLKVEEVTQAKDRLTEIAERLEAVGGRREARSLRTIIAKLDAWQNK